MSEEIVTENIQPVTTEVVTAEVSEQQPIVEEPVDTEVAENPVSTEAVEESVTEIIEPASEEQVSNIATDEPVLSETTEMEVEQPQEELKREPLVEPTLHISGLPVTIKASELAPILEAYGEVTKIVILPPKTIHQSYGFVSYETKEEAQRCLDELNNTKLVFDSQYTWKINWARQGPLKNANLGPSGRPYTFTDKPRGSYRRGGFRGGYRGGRGGYRGGRGGFRGGRGGYRPY
ncbi:hypothetical protein DAHU10_006430 [Hanseniaspora uvarum]|nr:hypothetical protein DAHU10_006430 [Hanseniaspora uvarum]